MLGLSLRCVVATGMIWATIGTVHADDESRAAWWRETSPAYRAMTNPNYWPRPSEDYQARPPRPDYQDRQVPRGTAIKFTWGLFRNLRRFRRERALKTKLFPGADQPCDNQVFVKWVLAKLAASGRLAA